MDHAQLVHKQWTHVAEQGLNVYIVRVGTHDNIADLPSREVRLPWAKCSSVRVVCVLRKCAGFQIPGGSRR